jgi:tetratricopeptide (TPR) repeat protein
MKRIDIISGLVGIAACLAMLPTAANAAGSSSRDPATQPEPDPYKQAKSLIDDQNYTQAIPILKHLIAQQGAYADALNLLGYSYRKTGDANTALVYYNQALQMEPKHLGANEYLGELYLELKQPDKANERLAVLKSACGDCEEFEDLSKAIQKYKAIN